MPGSSCSKLGCIQKQIERRAFVQHHESISKIIRRASALLETNVIIARRDGSNNTTNSSPLSMNLLIALVTLLFVGLCLSLIAILLGLRARRRNRRREVIDMPFEASPRPASRFSTHTLLTVATGPFTRQTETNLTHEKEILIDKESFESPIERSIPEIRITLAEETDEGGKRQSGRVVRVNISEAGGVGYEPCNDDHLPSSERSNFSDFRFVDLERIGGLKEAKKY